MRLPVLSRRHDRHRSRGQSLVEMALIAPVLLIILLLAIDFGRAFYSWVILQNAARIGANFAGVNADAWKADPDNATVVGQYGMLVEEDADRALCDPAWGGGPPPDPVFTDSSADTSSSGQTPDTSYDVGDSARVELACDFHPLTPIVSAVLSANVRLGASSEFRIRAGDIAGLNNAPAIPPPSNSTPTPTATVAPTATATGTTPPGPCTVAITRNPSSQNIDSGTVVTFGATATGCTITSFAWTFGPLGNPTNSTAAAPAVTFTTANNTSVTVTLVAETTGGQRTANDTFNLKK